MASAEKGKKHTGGYYVSCAATEETGATGREIESRHGLYFERGYSCKK
jgi:hypothetical protein